jgi:hypothetical protein
VVQLQQSIRGATLSKDDIGERGQAMFFVMMTELCGRSEPYFRPRFLGDKFPTFDYLLELVDYPGFFFFVQVKTTKKGFTRKLHKLRIQVSQRDVDRMVAWQVPSYVVGIDEPSQAGYLLSVNEPRQRVASLDSRFKIDCTVLAQLAAEVQQFWSSRNMVLTNSKFKG